MTLLKQILGVIDLLEAPEISKGGLERFFGKHDSVELETEEIAGDKGKTLLVRIHVRGAGQGPTLGVVGRLGGVSARPGKAGLVSDADGAIVALSVALKLAEMASRGDKLKGDVIVVTHIATKAVVRRLGGVAMMESPVDIFGLLKKEADPRMDAVVSIDATKANRVVNHNGIAITPVVKDGWILRIPDEILDIYVRVTGDRPVIVPLTMQDVTPFTTRVRHINSIVQPWIYTEAPVLGVATTARETVPGSATGATNPFILDMAARFVLEVAKEYTAGNLRFYVEDEWRELIATHGDLGSMLRKGAPP